ncbi:MAG TPA: hypothetical protein VHQ70_00030, partial [Syntrophomonadaceae bacterium]|nr:hypothetical protein [Syntrophomonadaceae bacterium]
MNDDPSLFRSTTKPDSPVALSCQVNPTESPSTVAVSLVGVSLTIVGTIFIGFSNMFDPGLMAAEYTGSTTMVISDKHKVIMVTTFF